MATKAAGEVAASASEAATRTAKELASRGVTEAVSSAGDKAVQVARGVGASATETAKDAGKLARQAASGTGAAVTKAKEKVTAFADEHPIDFEAVIEAAVMVPGVRIDREQYLLGALGIHTTEQMAREAIATSPARAGIPDELIERLAQEAISYENNVATATSVAAGLPSSPVLAAGVTVADLGQFYAHALRVAQKLGYLYGWQDVFRLGGNQMDDATRNVVILFLGVMSGVNGAQKTLMAVAKNAGMATGKRVARQALTKGAIYPIVKKVAYYLGIQMNKQIFGRAVGHTVPILGGAISGAMTWATFTPMANRLKDYLAQTPLARAGNAAVIEVPDVEVDDLAAIEQELDAEIGQLEAR